MNYDQPKKQKDQLLRRGLPFVPQGKRNRLRQRGRRFAPFLFLSRLKAAPPLTRAENAQPSCFMIPQVESGFCPYLTMKMSNSRIGLLLFQPMSASNTFSCCRILVANCLARSTMGLNTTGFVYANLRPYLPYLPSLSFLGFKSASLRSAGSSCEK
jgi:hypothetical protein